MPAAKHSDDGKGAALLAHHALNPRPERVTDPTFLAGAPFLDARDLVQVKYEMLRRVRVDGQSASHASAAFGFSRPAFYQAQAAFDANGLPGLLPQRPGPRRAHKLTPEVIAVLEQIRQAEPRLSPADLADRLKARLGLSVHPRSIERRLAARQKKGRSTQGRGGPSRTR
jgi:transposase